MKTQNLVQLNADVVRITSLTKGDVVKIINTDYNAPRKSFAVVLDLLNDGVNTFVEMLVYKNDYSEIEVDIITYKGDTDISIFPCEITEVEEYLHNAISKMDKKIEEQEINLNKLKISTIKAKEFVSGELSKKLKEVSFTSIPQTEYNDQQKIKEQEIAKLSN